MFDMKELRKAGKSATLWGTPFGGRTMPLKAKPKAEQPRAKPVGDEVFDDFDALVQLVQKSAAEAVGKVADDNAARGLPVYGAEKGRLVTRKPTGKRGSAPSREPG
jgi:hypothetical protein